MKYEFRTLAAANAEIRRLREGWRGAVASFAAFRRDGTPELLRLLKENRALLERSDRLADSLEKLIVEAGWAVDSEFVSSLEDDLKYFRAWRRLNFSAPGGSLTQEALSDEHSNFPLDV